MSTTPRFTSSDIELMPEDGNRYEVVDGELYVTHQPHWNHQYACTRLGQFLGEWNDQTQRGIVNTAPGLIFGEDQDVAPDVVWISRERLATALQPDGKLHAAPEIVVEVLSPGSQNQRRDRQTKLKLYARRGVQEYWIVDWQNQQIEIFRREQATLILSETLFNPDSLVSTLLPGFSCSVSNFWLRL